MWIIVSRHLVGIAMRLYRASPLHPRWGPHFARLLSLIQRRSRTVVHDVGAFRMELDLAQVVDTQIYYTDIFEPMTVDTISRTVRPGDVAVDVVANVGFITLTLAHHTGVSGSVFAFEPTVAAFARLERNLALNAFPQVHTLKVGLSDKVGTTCARIQSSFRIDGKDEVLEEEIALTTLDAWVGSERLARLDFLKIDTDGMEAQVLRGAQNTLRRLRPVVLFEFLPQLLRDAGESAEGVLGLLAETGYLILREGALTPWQRPEDAIDAAVRGRFINVVAWPRERALPPSSM